MERRRATNLNPFVNPNDKHATRESSARRGWLSSFFDDYRRRAIVALALAIAIHEVIAGALPYRRPPPVPKETISMTKIVRIEHRPRPTPRPKPKPTPRPVVHAKIVAPTHVKPRVVSPANPSQHAHVKRVASARPLVRTRYHSKPAAIHVPTGGHGSGASTKAKAPTGGVGPGGAGTGESGNGNGTGGAPLAHEPCGYVDFQPSDNPIVDKATGRIWEHIEMTVNFPDGTKQDTDLDYVWYYPTRADDPFMPGNAGVPATFQFPPADKRASEPPLVQYVIAHTTPDGFTTLHDCPK